MFLVGVFEELLFLLKVVWKKFFIGVVNMNNRILEISRVFVLISVCFNILIIGFIC